MSLLLWSPNFLSTQLLALTLENLCSLLPNSGFDFNKDDDVCTSFSFNSLGEMTEILVSFSAEISFSFLLSGDFFDSTFNEPETISISASARPPLAFLQDYIISNQLIYSLPALIFGDEFSSTKSLESMTKFSRSNPAIFPLFCPSQLYPLKKVLLVCLVNSKSTNLLGLHSLLTLSTRYYDCYLILGVDKYSTNDKRDLLDLSEKLNGICKPLLSPLRIQDILALRRISGTIISDCAKTCSFYSGMGYNSVIVDDVGTHEEPYACCAVRLSEIKDFNALATLSYIEGSYCSLEYILEIKKEVARNLLRRVFVAVHDLAEGKGSCFD